MTKLQTRGSFSHGNTINIGVIISNVGTPTMPTANSVKGFLREFLSDQRVVELPRWFWWPILRGIILNIRPRKSALAYKKIWTNKGSPLLVETNNLSVRIGERLQELGIPEIKVRSAMRYGDPSINSAVEILFNQNVRNFLIIPLYPQYASATTGSTLEKLFEIFKKMRWIPEVRVVNSYHDDPRYISALSNSIRKHHKNKGVGEKILFSFHGIPHDTFLAGDPYFCECQTTARLVASDLGLDEGRWDVSFQSRVGPKKWLQPYTDEVLRAWAKTGVKKIDVVSPGFAVDCLETLEEIAIGYKELLKKEYGTDLRYIPALNATDTHVRFITDLIIENLGTWIVQNRRKQAFQKSKSKRAEVMGAPDEFL